ncbi:Serpentine Receptor, class M [Caenorhabditis elegans]|uniref:Serpentine Receptor, class M n=1 Tax=Caenorhabditis elegans TaxID=6239 RepID=Q20522_CAEEL|nr:Serpentine Receptor, class M [Caenorhabditis elegans]CAB01197.1 Serpentine Receptor, class M [Caenorhabditis elegans]|eukprot:NP_506554.1 Serpentine Receptor, class M [Caenorhabditis elegans]
MTSTAPPESESSDDIGPPAELGPIIRSYHFYNDLVAGVLSIMLNVLVILVFTTRISTASKLFKKVMTVTKLVEMLFSASYILTAPVFTSISVDDSFTGLMIVNTGWQFNFYYSQIVLAAALVFLTQQIFLAPWLYYIRYDQVCKKHGVRCIDFLKMLIINLIFQVLTSVSLCFSSFPTSKDITELQFVANKFTGSNSAFLLLSYTKEVDTVREQIEHVGSIMSAVAYVLTLILSILVMILCTIKINLKVRESKNSSNNLLVLQKKMNRVLLAQFFCPLIFIQAPFYYSVLGPIVGLSQGLVTDLLPLLFAWSPVVNTLFIFILNSEIRNALIGKQHVSTSEVRSFANKS